MGEEKFTGDQDTVGSINAENTIPASVSEEKNNSEHSGEHSHHHRHHSSSHHHSSGSHRGSHRNSSSHGQSGSHRHRHSRRRHRSRIRKWFSSLRRFFKKLNNKKRVTFVCAIALVFIMMFSISLDLITTVLNSKAEKDALENENNGDVLNILNVELINGEGVLVTDAVIQYLMVDVLAEHNKNVKVGNFVTSGKNYNVQNSVAIKVSTASSIANAYKVEISDNPRFDGAVVSYFEGDQNKFVFEHLYASTKYYYRVTAYTASGVVSKSGNFTTADTPRILTIDGIQNVRDIGNWQTDSGKRIKQGLLIRGTELDGAIESGYHLTYEGLDDMLNVYGIKFDMDLRSETATPLGSDALGSHVQHKYYDMVMYTGIFTDEGKAKVKEVFADLANPNNYPMYLHCTYGRDRTGTICFLLEALLGVSRGDCLKEYGLSNVTIEYILEVDAQLAKLYGQESPTLKGQVERYLLSCGVTTEDMEIIRNIFLGE